MPGRFGIERRLDRPKVDLIVLVVMKRFPQLRAPECLKLLHPIEPSYYPFSSATTSMSAWKARVRELTHAEQSLNTETPPIRNTQGTRPSGVSYSELNQR